MDFEVQRCTRQCATSGRLLQPGETFYSVLTVSGADVVRQDYSAETWAGPPSGALGWWKSQMPEPNASKINWAPNDVMLHLLEEMEPQPELADMRYVLTLLLIRRRVLRLEGSQRDERGEEWLVVYSHKKETTTRVRVATPNATRIHEIQAELARLLFADAG
jgi:hypothetical protein